MAKFRKTLEEKAAEIATIPRKELWENSVPGMLRREIALTVDQMKRLKQRHDEQFLQLLRLECYVDTDLMQLEQYHGWLMPHNFEEREKLRQKLLDIEKERRSLSLRLDEKAHTLEDKLLSLINKHQQLDG